MNLRFLARQLTNIALTTVGHINDDRVFFGMQLARRLPGPASRFVGHALGRLPGDASRAASAWLLGEETAAKSLVAALPPSRLSARSHSIWDSSTKPSRSQLLFPVPVH